ncbi:MAG TPA: type II toxin-antitoxin system RelE/ParE family toxin [Syntrophomonadaceae bacterium]|nr:type II toxin-antitoxin system RelE/ParE family toxin [Syntrophomonadaceae bacterium]
MKMYKILRTDKAEDQLRDIIYYIADDSGSTDTALRYLDKIEEAINRLQEFPNSGSIPRYSILKKQGYRVVIIERHLVFYKVNYEEKTVIIYAIVDGRREYKNLI